MTASKDIEGRADLFLLMEHFYKKLLADPSISYFFTDIAKINIETHFPVLVDFWEMVLFQADTYNKNAVQVHYDLHTKSPIRKEHFDTWLSYFHATVDELFDGPNAFRAKEKAKSIATIMQIKMSQLKG